MDANSSGESAPLESLVNRCLDAGPAYRAELDQACNERPGLAAALRQRIEQLEQLGFIGTPSTSGPESAWHVDRVGRYRLTDLVGRGGMGVVFRGRANGGDEVAVKIVRPDLLADERVRERFRREALAASRLSDPGICPVLEVGVDNDIPFLVMPLLHGSTFDTWARAQRSTPGASRAIASQIEAAARSLHAAHQLGLVHRDITPGNVFVTDDGRAVVLDFGLARDVSGELPTLTGSQELLGTLPYMAPEQIDRRIGTIDRRVDVYALGILAYQALAGRLPHDAEQRHELVRQIVSGEHTPLRRTARDVPPALARIVAKAMDEDPRRRYATSADLADDLRRFLDGKPVRAREPGPLLRARRWSRRHPIAATAVATLSIGLAVAVALLVRLSDEIDKETATAEMLTSRSLENVDPIRALEHALATDVQRPTAASLGQLNRVLHGVSVLGQTTITSGNVRDLEIIEGEGEIDLAAVATDHGLSLLQLDRRDGRIRERWSVPAPDGVQLGLARFSHDGKLLATGGTGKSAFVMATDRPGFEKRFATDSQVFSTIFCDGDRTLWTAENNGLVRAWSLGPAADTPTELFDTKTVDGPGVRGMRPVAAGGALLWTRRSMFRLDARGECPWHWPAAPDRTTFDSPPVFDAGLDLVVAAYGGIAHRLRWVDGTEIAQLPSDDTAPVVSALISAEGTIVTVHGDGEVRLWSSSGAFLASYRDTEDDPGNVVAARDGSFLVVGVGGRQVKLDNRLRFEDVLGGGPVVRYGVPGPHVWSSDGVILMSFSQVGMVRSWDYLGRHSLPRRHFVESSPRMLAAHPDGRSVLVVGKDHDVRQWDPAAGGIVKLNHLPLDPFCVGQSREQGPVAFAGAPLVWVPPIEKMDFVAVLSQDSGKFVPGPRLDVQLIPIGGDLARGWAPGTRSG